MAILVAASGAVCVQGAEKPGPPKGFVPIFDGKVLGKGANAGVQFRSERVPKSNEMIGYQADMADGYWGCLYDERRHKMLTGPSADRQNKIIRQNDWNEPGTRTSSCETSRSTSDGPVQGPAGVAPAKDRQGSTIT